MASVRFIIARITAGQYGSSDFTITAKGSIAVNDRTSAYALNLQGSSGDRRKLIANGAVSLTTKNAAGAAVLFATSSGEALDGALLFDGRNPAVSAAVDTTDASESALARGIAALNLTIGRDPDFTPSIPGRVDPWQAALNVSAIHRNGDAEATAIDAAGTLDLAGLLKGSITVKAAAYTDSRSAVVAESGIAVARGLSSVGAMSLAGVDSSFRLTVAASGSTTQSGNAGAEAYGLVSNSTLTVTGDLRGTYNVTATGGGSSRGLAEAYGIAAGISIAVSGTLGATFTVTARSSSQGSGNNDAFAYGIAASLLSTAEVADNCRMTINSTAGQGTSVIATGAAFFIDGGLLGVAGRFGGTYSVRATGGLGGYGAAQAFGIFAAGVTAGVLAGSWTVNARGRGVNGNLSGLAEAYGVQSTGNITLTGGSDKNLRLTVSATGAIGKIASAVAIAFCYAGAFSSGDRFGGTLTVSAIGGQATAIPDSVSNATAYGIDGGGDLALASLGGTFNLTARSGRDASEADAVAAGIAVDGALSIGSVEKTFRLTANATSNQTAGFTSGSASAAGISGASLTAAGEWYGTYNITAVGGRSGTVTATAYGLETTAGGMSFGTLGGTYQVTARGGVSGGVSGRAAATALSCSGGDFSAGAVDSALRLTVSATAGSGGDDASAAAIGIYTNRNVTVDASFFANIQVTATAGKSSGDESATAQSEAYGLRFDQESGDWTVAGTVIEGALGGSFSVRSSGGSGGDDVIAWCYGIRSALALTIGSIDTRFQLSATAAGGTGKNATVVLHGIRSDSTLTVAGTVGGRFTITGTGGTGTGGGSVNLNLTGLSGVAGVVLGDFDTGFRLTVTGTAGKGSFASATSDVRGIDSGAGMTLGDLAGSITVRANGNGAANGTLLEAYGIAARGGDLTTGEWNKSFSLTLTVNAQKEYGIGGYGLSASGAIAIAKLAGTLSVTVNGGSAAAGPVRSYGFLAYDGITVNQLAINTFRLTVRGCGGYGTDGSVEVSGMLAADGDIVFAAALAGSWTVEGYARGNNSATLASASARSTVVEAADGSVTVDGVLAGTFRAVAIASTSTGESNALAAVISASGAVNIADGFGSGSSLTALATGGSGSDASAVAKLISADGALTVTGTLFGAATVTANGGKGSDDSSAKGYGFCSSGSLTLGTFDRTFRLTVNATGGSGTNASAHATGVAGIALTVAELAGRFTLTARGRNNTGSAAAEVIGLDAETTLTVASVDSAFYLALTAVAGSGLDAGVAAAGYQAGGDLTFVSGIGGTLSASATGGVGTGEESGNSTARACGLWSDGGTATIGGSLAGTWTVNARAGSKSVANEAEAAGIYAEAINLGNTFEKTFRLTVSATGGTGSAASAAAGGLIAETGNLGAGGALNGNWTITARGGSGPDDATADASGLSGATGITLNGDASTMRLTVTATGGRGFDASAEAYGFTTDGVLVSGGTLGGNYQIKAQGGSGLGDGSPEAAAQAAWISSGGAASLAVASTAVINVTAAGGSAVDADAEAAGIYSTANAGLAMLGGSWTVAATGGRSGSNGSAEAYGIRADGALTVAAVDLALRFSVSASGGSAYGNTNAWAAGLSGREIDITSSTLGGSWTIKVTAGAGDFSAHAIGAWISSVPLDPGQGASSGTVAIGAMLTATVSVTVKGGAGSNAPQVTAGYGIWSELELALTGGVAASFKLTVTVNASATYAPNSMASAYGVMVENAVDTVEVSGSIAGVWSISATGGNANQDGSALSAGFYSAADDQEFSFGNFGSSCAMTVKAAGGKGSNADANAWGIFAGYLLSIASFAGQLTVSASGGSATVLADSNAGGLVGNAITSGDFTSGGKIKVTATGGSGLASSVTATGVSAAGTVTFNAFAGTIAASATGGRLSSGSGGDASGTAAGIEAGTSLAFASFTGGVNAVAKGGAGSGTNHAYAYGLKVGTTLSVATGVVAGTVSATATAGSGGDATACGIRIASLTAATEFAGKITATATGLSAADDAGAWGVKADDFNGVAVTVSGVIVAAGSTRAVGISGNNLNLTVTGVIFAGKNGNADTLANSLWQLWNNNGSAKGYLSSVNRLNGEAIAIQGGSGMDTVKLGSGSIVIGDIDFGSGSDVLMISSGAQLVGSLTVDSAADNPLAWTYVLDTAASKNAIITLPGDLNDALQGSTVSVSLETGRIGEYILLEGASGIDISIKIGDQVITVGETIYGYNGVVINFYRKSIGGGRDQLILSAQPAPEPPAAASGNDWSGAAVTDTAASVALIASLTVDDGAAAVGSAVEALDAGLTLGLDEYAVAATTELGLLGDEEAISKYGLLAAV